MTLSRDMPPNTAGFLSRIIKSQFSTKLVPPPAGTDLSGQVAIVTGANSGLGFEAANHLLALGLSHLVVAVRSLDRGKAAAEKLQLANPKAKIDVWSLDMESYQSIQEFARQCDAELPRIDIAILNAGIADLIFGVVPSTGHEKIMQVNYLSTMLLLILLLPILKAKSTPGTATPPRITIVNSATASSAKFSNRNARPLLPSFDDTNITPWDGRDRYGTSKLVSQFFLDRLADHVNPDHVCFNFVEPGLTKTALFRHAKGVAGFIWYLFVTVAARPADNAALTYINAAVVQGKESHGCFVILDKIGPLANPLYEPEAKTIGDAIWEETLDELEFAGAREIIQSLSK